MAAPQVTGLVALLVELNPDAGPDAIRDHVRETAAQLPVGEEVDGEYATTAPDRDDDRSGFVRAAEERPESETYRGHGHVDTLEAVSERASD